MHISRTSYRSPSPGNIGRHPQDIVGQILANMMAAPPTLRGGTDRRGGPSRPYSPGMGFGIHGYDPSRNSNGPRFGPTSPLQEGPSRQGNGGNNAYSRLRPRDANAPQPQGLPLDDLHG